MSRAQRSVLVVLFVLCLTGLSCRHVVQPIPAGPDSLTEPEAAYRAGVAVLEAGSAAGETDYRLAHEQFARACELADTAEGRRPELFYNAGWTADRLGDRPGAERYYVEALTVDDGYLPALFSLSQLLARDGRTGEAADLFEGYLEDHPDDRVARVQLASLRGEAGDIEGAADLVQDLLADDPEDNDAVAVLTRAYYRAGAYDMALLIVDMLGPRLQQDSDLLNTVGLTYLRSDDPIQASQMFQQALVLDPEHVQANLNLGYLATDSGDYTQAATCFQAVLRSQPGSADAHLGLAGARVGIADVDGALAEYDVVLAADPRHPVALLHKASMLAHLERYDETLYLLHLYGEYHGMAEVAGRIEEVEYDRAERARIEQEIKDARDRYEQILAEGRRLAAELNLLIDRAYCLHELHGAEADAVHPSFNETLAGHVHAAEDAVEFPDDPSYLRTARSYLQDFVRTEYLPALGLAPEIWDELECAGNE